MAQVGLQRLRWGIVLIDFDPARGHEQAGRRRAVVVSSEAFHRSGMATVCPITTRGARYPAEIPIPDGHAGQTRNGLILVHRVRTVDLARVHAYEVHGSQQFVTDPGVRKAVRSALAHHLGLDIPGPGDGAA